jgi:hypothetical protein
LIDHFGHVQPLFLDRLDHCSKTDKGTSIVQPNEWTPPGFSAPLQMLDAAMIELKDSKRARAEAVQVLASHWESVSGM